MCDCVKTIEQDVLENLKSSGILKKPVQSVSLMGIGFPLVAGRLLIRTCNLIEVTLEGQKKKATINVFHRFCPFCGEEYDRSAPVEGG